MLLLKDKKKKQTKKQHASEISLAFNVPTWDETETF